MDGPGCAPQLSREVLQGLPANVHLQAGENHTICDTVETRCKGA